MDGEFITSKTHSEFALGFVYIGAMTFFSLNIVELNYYLMLIIMVFVGNAGALFPDLDSNWKTLKNKTKLKWVINKLIHITGGKHRSWQTHSLDICLLVGIAGYVLLYKGKSLNIFSDSDYEVALIILIGFILGWISHLFSDMLTPNGIRLLFFSKFKLSVVPRAFKKNNISALFIVFISLGIILLHFQNQYGIIFICIGFILFCLSIKYSNVKFSTGSQWEVFFYKTIKILNFIMAILSIIYPFIVKLYTAK